MQVRQGRVNFITVSELPEGAPVMTAFARSPPICQIL
jgi:hypothetical protein